MDLRFRLRDSSDCESSPPRPNLGSLLTRFVTAIEEWARSTSRLATAAERATGFLGEKIIVIAGTFGLSGLTSTSEGESTVNYLLPNDQPDNPYSLPTVTVKDAEGESITSEITESFTSTDPAVVEIINNGDPHDPEGKVHFGHSGVANLNYLVNWRDQPIYSATITITITTGQAAVVDTAGEFGLPGISPVEEPPVPEPPPPVPPAEPTEPTEPPA